MLSEVALSPSKGRYKNGLPLKIYTFLFVLYYIFWKAETLANKPYFEPPNTKGNWLF